jgi:hypothetical protein
MYRSVLCLAVLAAVAVNGGAQQRRATIIGGGAPDRGKCTIEVVVDVSAEVVVRGESATLRTLAGRPAEWRRFECTGPLPTNPAEFRFAGVDGRGRQQLVSDPRNGGSAVVRIEDQQGGSEGYTFDLFWGGYNTGGNPGYSGGRQGGGRRLGEQEAVRVCQDSVRQEAAQRFRGRVEFLDGRIDDNPGRNDWIVGRISVRNGNGQEDMRYSCSVDFESGRVRSASIDPVGRGDGRGYGRDGGNGGAERALESCRRAVTERMRQDGYGRVEFTSTRMDDNPGRNDWVVGTAQAYRGPNFQSYSFSCSVNLRDGDVRSVDVRRR